MEYIGNLRVISTFKTVTLSIEPTKEQFETFARRIAPEIKAFFDDEHIQKDYADWHQEQQN